jgi:outer membrane protein TolC/ABC-type uncharacterized transport system substrate-binding protein
MKTLARTVAVLGLFLLSAVSLAETRQIHVGIVTDGPTDRDALSLPMIRRAISDVVGTDIEIVLSEEHRFEGDWSMPGVNAALDRALADRNVDVVLALGILSSHEAAHRPKLAKPVIAAVVIDPVLQGFPLEAGRSGRHNFTYAADFQNVGAQVRAFQNVVGFRRLVALVDEALLDALPELTRKADELATALKGRIDIVRTGQDPKAVLAAIPPDADAVYVTGLLRFREQDIRELADGLKARHLPSYSVLGRSEVESGLLMTSGGVQQDGERLARRIVLMIQRIADGDDPATFDVSFPTEQRLVINMQTARAIGFSPRWQFLADAEQLNPEPGETRPGLTLVGAMQEALASNPALTASRARLESSADDIAIARSNLLPSIDATATSTRIDEDRASPITQAEQQSATGLEFQQLLYSERAWAGLSISKYLNQAQSERTRQDVLDTLESAATSYFDLLRAKSVESVRRSNVENTRKNLETSRVREAVGLAERSDYLRWVAQLARDKQSLLEAESTRRQAEAALVAVLHRPANQSFTTEEAGLDDPLGLVSSPRMQAYLDTPDGWAKFMEYVVSAALEHSPEIGQSRAVIRANERQVTASKRAYFLPDLALVSSGSNAFSRSGAGSDAIPGGPDDETWNVSLQVSFPLFTGGSRKAELSQARHDLRASQADLASATDSVEARARIALHRTAGSYPSIELSREAAAAANENLAMVTDAYARGAVSVTDLIDAQESALSAGLAAADAKYAFLSDFIGVLRAMSEFDILLDPESREQWFKQLDDWLRTQKPTDSSPTG